MQRNKGDVMSMPISYLGPNGEKIFVTTDTPLPTSGGSGGEPGPAGKSAYQIAVDHGFEGTESDWLLSLRGHPTEEGWNTLLDLYMSLDARVSALESAVDDIRDGGDPDPDPELDPPASITIDPTEHTFIPQWERGTVKYFTVTILPETADQSYTMESSNEEVVRIDSEKRVIAWGSGTATVTVRTVNDLTATATVTVP